MVDGNADTPCGGGFGVAASFFADETIRVLHTVRRHYARFGDHLLCGNGEADKGKIKLFSLPLEYEQNFEDSSLYPIYQLILERETDLEKVQILHQDAEYWYRKN
jgi:hypothetical protein